MDEAASRRSNCAVDGAWVKTNRAGSPFSRAKRPVQSGKVLLQEGGVDVEGRLGSFRSGDDHPLDRAGGVTGDVEPGQVGGLIWSGAHRAFVVHLAAETEGELRLLRLSGGEEERGPVERRSVGEDDALQPSVSLEAHDTLLAHPDSVAIEARKRVRLDPGRAVGAEHEVAAPPGELQRQSRAAGAAAVDRQRLVAHFPAVAVGAVEHARAVELAKAG